MKYKLICLAATFFFLSCSNDQTDKERLKQNTESAPSDTSQNIYVEPITEEPFILETELKLNKSGTYEVPVGKMWSIRSANGINPIYGSDSTGIVHINCGGFQDIEASYEHECGVIENVTAEKFKTDKINVVWYYVNSYPDLFVKEGHQFKYKRGSSTEILNIAQYTINK